MTSCYHCGLQERRHGLLLNGTAQNRKISSFSCKADPVFRNSLLETVLRGTSSRQKIELQIFEEVQFRQNRCYGSAATVGFVFWHCNQDQLTAEQCCADKGSAARTFLCPFGLEEWKTRRGSWSPSPGQQRKLSSGWRAYIRCLVMELRSGRWWGWLWSQVRRRIKLYLQIAPGSAAFARWMLSTSPICRESSAHGEARQRTTFVLCSLL